MTSDGTPLGAPAEPSFEAAIERLSEIVEQIEGESLELDESLALFEEGIRLLRVTEGMLSDAESRIDQLLEGSGGVRLEPLREEP